MLWEAKAAALQGRDVGVEGTKEGGVLGNAGGFVKREEAEIQLTEKRFDALVRPPCRAPLHPTPETLHTKH